MNWELRWTLAPAARERFEQSESQRMWGDSYPDPAVYEARCRAFREQIQADRERLIDEARD